jgi:hypothetical protein
LDSTFGKEINRFILHIDSLKATLDMLMGVVMVARGKASDLFEKFIGGKILHNDDKKIIIPRENVSEYKKLQRQLETYDVILKILPRSYLIYLISQYDAYFGCLLKLVFNLQPGLLNNSREQIVFSKLASFKEIQEVIDYVMEKEVESFLRDSHYKQFEKLEAMLKMPFKKDLKIWPKFIEITERRNLFVHCDGVASTQYLLNCKEHGVKFSNRITAGDQLDVSRSYFLQSCDVIYEIGVKLGHVLWRKLNSKNLEEADRNYTEITYNLISNERYVPIPQKSITYSGNSRSPIPLCIRSPIPGVTDH